MKKKQLNKLIIANRSWRILHDMFPLLSFLVIVCSSVRSRHRVERRAGRTTPFSLSVFVLPLIRVQSSYKHIHTNISSAFLVVAFCSLPHRIVTIDRSRYPPPPFLFSGHFSEITEIIFVLQCRIYHALKANTEQTKQKITTVKRLEHLFSIVCHFFLNWKMKSPL